MALLDNPLTFGVGAILLLLGLGCLCCALNNFVRLIRLKKHHVKQDLSQRKEKRRELALLNSFTASTILAETIGLSRTLGPHVKPVAKECVACFEQPRQVLLPCGHCLLCEKCATAVLAASGLCPTCRTPFLVFKRIPGHLPSFRHLPIGEDGQEGAPKKFFRIPLTSVDWSSMIPHREHPANQSLSAQNVPVASADTQMQVRAHAQVTIPEDLGDANPDV